MRAWLLCGPPPVTSQSQPCATASRAQAFELAGLVAAEREAGEVVALHEQPRVDAEARRASRSIGSTGVGRSARPRLVRQRRGHARRARGRRRHHTYAAAPTPAAATTVPTAIVGPFGGTGTRSRRRTGRGSCGSPTRARSPRASRSLSGFTATGCPTTSSIGTSVTESLYAYDSERSMSSRSAILADRVGLVRAVRVELELAGVVAVVVDLARGWRSPRRHRGTRRAARRPRPVTTTRSRPCARRGGARRRARAPPRTRSARSPRRGSRARSARRAPGSSPW